MEMEMEVFPQDYYSLRVTVVVSALTFLLFLLFSLRRRGVGGFTGKVPKIKFAVDPERLSGVKGGPGQKIIFPIRGTSYSAGWDLYMPENLSLCRGKHLLDTGMVGEIPRGYCGVIHLRSSWGRKLRLLSDLIDSDYRGPIKIAVEAEHPLDIEAGTCLAQLVVHPFVGLSETTSWDKLSKTKRGTGGFGSTSEDDPFRKYRKRFYELVKDHTLEEQGPEVLIRDFKELEREFEKTMSLEERRGAIISEIISIPWNHKRSMNLTISKLKKWASVIKFMIRTEDDEIMALNELYQVFNLNQQMASSCMSVFQHFYLFKIIQAKSLIKWIGKEERKYDLSILGEWLRNKRE